MMKRPGYLNEFLEFWTPRDEVHKVWFSIFTPQVGDRLPEILTPAERSQAVAEMLELRKKFPKLDMPDGLVRQFITPPHSPADCVFRLDHTDNIRGPEDQDRALSVRRNAGLRLLRLHRFHGIGRGGRAQTRWLHSGGSDLPDLGENRPGGGPARRDAGAKTRVTASVAVGARRKYSRSKNLSNVMKDEITSLLELSGRIGQNALLTQASTGNTSVKLGGVLWVKASGTWLAHAKQRNILMPMDLESRARLRPPQR